MSVRFSEQEYEDYLKRQGRPQICPSGEVSEKEQGNSLPVNIKLILPFKLPTWNQLLSMDHWQRAKVREWIKKRVLECIQNGAEWRTPTGLARKLLLTDLSLAEYSRMITPNASRKLLIAKKQAKLKKR